MMERSKAIETLEARVRETPLRERLEQSGERIGAMCSERRGPRMCIPVAHTDDDFFISTTLRDAVATIDQLQATLAAREARIKELAGLCRQAGERIAELSRAQRAERGVGG